MTLPTPSHHPARGHQPQPPLFAAALVLAVLLASPVVLAQTAQGCDVPVQWEGISPATAQQAGLQQAGGRYVVDAEALARRAGGASALLDASDQQIRENMAWFHAVEGLLEQDDTPSLPDLEAVYRQALETHEVELAMRHAMQCALGLQPSPAERPKTLATLQQERQSRIAEARAQTERAQARQGLFQALGAVGQALGAAGAAAATTRPTPGDLYSDELADAY